MGEAFGVVSCAVGVPLTKIRRRTRGAGAMVDRLDPAALQVGSGPLQALPPPVRVQQGASETAAPGDVARQPRGLMWDPSTRATC
jgi:hypothetical protein